MFAVPENGVNIDREVIKGKRHCILVTASNPFPLPVPTYRPNIDGSGAGTMNCNVETVARWFEQCSVSLSVISARKLANVRAIYEAANNKNRSEDPTVHIQHPRFLVLISKSFTEARAALNLPDVAAPQDPVTSLEPNSGASSSSQPVDQPASEEQHVSIGDIASASLDNVESNVNSMLGPSASSDATAISMQDCSVQPVRSKYLKLWQGNVFGMKHGTSIFISEVEVYGTKSNSPMLAANWPDSLHITQLNPQDHIYGNVARVLLVVRVLNNHPFFSSLQERKVVGVVKLPSQTLLLPGYDKGALLIGTLILEGTQ